MPITINNLSFTYAPGTPFASAALHDVSLRIEDGEFVGVMGRTGCGKSTLIQLIAGLLTPAAGQILLDGRNIFAKGYPRDELRRKVGIVFQYPEYQLFETTVARDVAFGLKHTGLDQAQIDQRVRWALEVMGFSYEAVKELSPLGLSGGEKRRVAIAGVLAVRPQVLILDEPIAGLDPAARTAFLELLTNLNAQGTTVIMVSHNADSLSEYTKRILVLEDGRLLWDGPSSSLFCDADVLSRCGLGLPQVQQIVRLLRHRGVEIAKDLYQYQSLAAALKGLYQGGDSR